MPMFANALCSARMTPTDDALDLQQLLAGSQPSRALDRLGDGRDAAIEARATIQGAPR